VDCGEVNEEMGGSEVIEDKKEEEVKEEVEVCKVKDNVKEGESVVSKVKAVVEDESKMKRKSCSGGGGRRGGGGGCGDSTERLGQSSSDHEDCSVEACLAQFTSVELLTGSNKVTCSTCTSRQGNIVLLLYNIHFRSISPKPLFTKHSMTLPLKPIKNTILLQVQNL
jgi:hypothetical protein